MRQRYIIQCTKIPQEERDVYRSFSDPQFRNAKRLADIGDKAVYSVVLSEEEVEAARASNNLTSIEPDLPLTPDVGTSIPAVADLKFHKAESYYAWGWTGKNIVIGVADSGLAQSVRSMFNIKAAKSFVNQNPYNDQSGHGTAVSALALPPDAQLVIGQTGQEVSMTSPSIEAIYWMVDEIGCDFIVYSHSGGSVSSAFEDAIDHASSEKCPVYCSAGNDGQSPANYPARYASAVGVGALDRSTGKRWSGSNYGTGVDLWASGVNIHTMNTSGGAKTSTGTSYSTPIAVWIAASQAGKTKPNGVDPKDVTDNLIDNPMNEGGVTPENAGVPSTGGQPLFDENGNPILNDDGTQATSPPATIPYDGTGMPTGVPVGNPENLPIGDLAMDGTGSLPSLKDFC